MKNKTWLDRNEDRPQIERPTLERMFISARTMDDVIRETAVALKSDLLYLETLEQVLKGDRK